MDDTKTEEYFKQLRCAQELLGSEIMQELDPYIHFIMELMEEDKEEEAENSPSPGVPQIVRILCYFYGIIAARVNRELSCSKMKKTTLMTCSFIEEGEDFDAIFNSSYEWTQNKIRTLHWEKIEEIPMLTILKQKLEELK